MPAIPNRQDDLSDLTEVIRGYTDAKFPLGRDCGSGKLAVPNPVRLRLTDSVARLGTLEPMFKLPVLTLLLISTACNAIDKPGERPHEEAVSLSGESLARVSPADERLTHYTGELADARARWEREGLEIDAIWVGRHLGYLGRYREAINWFTERLVDFPKSVRLRRHRGHRFISVRRFDDAIRDLEEAWQLARNEADEIEPDGAPNELGIPRSTTHTNVLYHLALAHYLKAEFGKAADYWRECADLSPNDDMLVASLNWTVHALRRDGREEEARRILERVTPKMDVIENHTYHRLLLLQKGQLSSDQVLGPESDGVQNATAAYGMGAWAYCNGDRERAAKLWNRLVTETPWNAFGHICAEAELNR